MKICLPHISNKELMAELAQGVDELGLLRIAVVSGIKIGSSQEVFGSDLVVILTENGFNFNIIESGYQYFTFC